MRPHRRHHHHHHHHHRHSRPSDRQKRYVTVYEAERRRVREESRLTIYLVEMWETRDDIPWRLLRLLDRVVVFYVAVEEDKRREGPKKRNSTT
jgi:hypothetical protein